MLNSRNFITYFLIFFPHWLYTQEVKEVDQLRQYHGKMCNYVIEFTQKAETLREYGRFEMADYWSDLADLAAEYALTTDHVADLLYINKISKEKAIQFWTENKIKNVKLYMIDYSHKAYIEMVDSIIDVIKKQAEIDRTYREPWKVAEEFKANMIALKALFDII